MEWVTIFRQGCAAALQATSLILCGAWSAAGNDRNKRPQDELLRHYFLGGAGGCCCWLGSGTVWPAKIILLVEPKRL